MKDDFVRKQGLALKVLPHRGDCHAYCPVLEGPQATLAGRPPPWLSPGSFHAEPEPGLAGGTGREGAQVALISVFVGS